MHPALGIDHGGARIGLAATDPHGILAHPLTTVPVAGGAELMAIAEIVAERKTCTVVVGIPYMLDGSEGQSAKRVFEFAKKLQPLIPSITIVFVDESFTTVDAAEKLHLAGKNAKKQKVLIDQAAAVEILNRWMEEN